MAAAVAAAITAAPPADYSANLSSQVVSPPQAPTRDDRATAVRDSTRRALTHKDSVVVLAPLAVRAPVVPPRWALLSYARLGRDDLTMGGRDPGQMLRYAKAVAGATLDDDRVYVDGLPATRLPAAEAIATLAINPDPFSVLYSESDQNVVDVITADPDRTVHWGGGHTSKAYGARNPLAPQLRSRRIFSDGRLNGPVPFTPFTFSTDLMLARLVEDRPVFGPSATGATQTDVAHSEARSQSVMVGLAGHWHRNTRVGVTVTATDADDTGGETGGFVRPEAGSRHTSNSRDARLVAETDLGRYRFRTGIAFAAGTNSFLAAPSSAALMVLETFVSGGSPFRSMRMENTEWRWNNVVATPTSSSLIGWSVAQSTEAEALVPNPEGQLIFGTLAEYRRWLSGEAAGTWMGASNRVSQRFASTTAAIYGQQEWHVGPAAILRSGVRADYQSDDGVLLSPRVSLSVLWGRATMTSGVGVFRQNWTNTVLLQARRYRCKIGCVADAFVGSGNLGADVQPLRSEIEPAFARPGALVFRHGVSIGSGRLTSGAEYSWTAAFSRPGSRRLADGNTLVDRLESTRQLRRHQLHTRVGYDSRVGSLVAHYEWVLSHDDSGGPFSFPERQDDLASEWAPSAGVSPHNASIVAGLPRLAGIETSVVFTARSRAPLNLRTGLDVDGTRLYGDRGGRKRNAGLGPGFRSLDAYAHRRVRVPFLSFGARPTWVDLSLLGENLLGNRNYLAVGSSLASPFLGRPVTAMAGRSVRLSLRMVR